MSTHEEAVGLHDSRQADQRDSVLLYSSCSQGEWWLHIIITTAELTLTLHTEWRASVVFWSWKGGRGDCTSCCSALGRLSPKLTDPSWSSSGREPWSNKAWGQTHVCIAWRSESSDIKYIWQTGQIYFCICIFKYGKLGLLYLTAQTSGNKGSEINWTEMHEIKIIFQSFQPLICCIYNTDPHTVYHTQVFNNNHHCTLYFFLFCSITSVTAYLHPRGSSHPCFLFCFIHLNLNSHQIFKIEKLFFWTSQRETE